MVITSTYSEGPMQDDGRRTIRERHEAANGQVIVREYLCTPGLDPQLVMDECAKVIEDTLAKREAARQAVIGYAVPMTHYQFFQRITPAERIAIRRMAQTDEIIADFLHMLDRADDVALPLVRDPLLYIASKNDGLTMERAIEIGTD